MTKSNQTTHFEYDKSFTNLINSYLITHLNLVLELCKSVPFVNESISVVQKPQL